MPRNQHFVAVAFAITMLVAAQSNASIISNFDDGTLQGWTNLKVGGFDVINPGTGGNPGGYLAFIDTLSGAESPALVQAPPQFSGDLSSFTSVEYDAFVIASAIQANSVLIEGSDGTVWSFRPELKGLEAWESYSIPLDGGNGWFLSGLSQGNTPFSEVIADVSAVYVGMAVSTDLGFESGIDNFRLIPEPSTLMALALISAFALRGRSRRLEQ